MMDCVTIVDAGEHYHITIPGKMIRASGLLAEEVEGASLGETHLALDDPTVMLEYDDDERTLTVQFPDPPEEIPQPEPGTEELSQGERAVLEQTEVEAD